MHLTIPIFLLVGVAVVAFLVISLLVALSLRRVVPTNMVHIVQSSRQTVSYGKGKAAGNVYYEWPAWVPGFGVLVTRFPESVFDIPLQNYEAYDVGRLPFLIDVRAFFRVSDSDVAAHRVASFEQLKGQLTAVLQGAVRRVLGTNHLELILSDRAKLAGEFTAEVDAQLQEWGVMNVKSIEFMDIRDTSSTSVIHQIMAKEESRIERESRVSVAANKQQASIAEIDAERTVNVQKQDAEQQVGVRKAERDKQVGIATQLAQQEVLVQTKETTTREMEVQQVTSVRQAEIEKNVAEVQAERNKNVAIVQAEGKRQALVIEADADKQQRTLTSEGTLAAQRNEAIGLEAVGAAKGAAETALLMAPVTAQITLAKEIGENASYQQYLVTVRNIEAQQAVGVQMAQAVGNADVKVIANGGNVSEGMNGVAGLFTSSMGTGVASFLAGLGQTTEGEALVRRTTGQPPAIPN